MTSLTVSDGDHHVFAHLNCNYFASDAYKRLPGVGAEKHKTYQAHQVLSHQYIPAQTCILCQKYTWMLNEMKVLESFAELQKYEIRSAAVLFASIFTLCNMSLVILRFSFQSETRKVLFLISTSYIQLFLGFNSVETVRLIDLQIFFMVFNVLCKVKTSGT